MVLEYSIDNTTTPIRLNQTIRVTNFNTSNWNSGSGNGMYLGLGYGCDEMENCDMTWCNYYLSGANGLATDRFSCVDVKTNETYFPINDTITNDVWNVSTITGGHVKAATAKFTTNNFAVRFVRPFRTNDTADYQLGSSNTPILWGLGYISNGFPVKHTSGMNGLAKLDLTMAQISNAFKIAFSMVSVAIVALNFF